MLTVTQEGAGALWQAILNVIPIGLPWCHLYGQAHTPAHTDTYLTYAAIAVPPSSGYLAQQLVQPGANWAIGPIGAGAQAQYITLSWTLTGPATVYGYWISDQPNSRSLWAEQLAAPWVWSAAAPVFTLSLIAWLTSYPDVGGIPCTAP